MQINNSRLLLATTVLVMALAVSCKKDKHIAIDSKCPQVIATSPITDDQNVSRNKVLTATFNEKMDPSTIKQDAFVLQGQNTIPGTVSYNSSDSTLYFTPSQLLIANTSYTASVLTSVMDLMGNALQTPYVWTFKTGATVDSIVPTIVSTDPADNSIGVPLNKVVSATFSQPMNPTTISGQAFVVKTGNNAISGVVTYSGNTAYFTPNALLTSATVYQATITTAVQNLSGNQMASPYMWSFTTGNSTVAPVPPQVISTDPVNNATGVAVNKTITATFDQAMNPSTLSNTSVLLKHGTTSVSGAVSYNGNTVRFVPAAPLLEGTVYNATITTAATNVAGTPLSANYVWTFSTVTTPTVAAPFIDLKSVARFGIIAGAGISNNAGFSEVHNMDVGISPGVRTSITGFPPAVIFNGAIYASDDTSPPGTAAMLTQAKQDLSDAYLFAEGATTPAPASVSGDLGGQTLAPGIYKTTSTLLIQSGNLTLDANGDPNAFWVFQIASGFTTVGGAGGSVILSGGAQAKNVFWQVGSSATIGDNTAFQGTILALTSITMNSNATAVGRMLCINGAVVLTNTNIINKP